MKRWTAAIDPSTISDQVLKSEWGGRNARKRVSYNGRCVLAEAQSRYTAAPLPALHGRISLHTDPLELSVRRVVDGREFREETVVRIVHTESVDAKAIEAQVDEAIRNLFKNTSSA